MDRQPSFAGPDVPPAVHRIVLYQEGNEQTAASSDRPAPKIAEWVESNKVHSTAKILFYS